MTTDLSQTWKDFVRLEDAALQTFVQESGTLLNALGIHLPGLSPVTEPPSANRSDTGSPFGSKITVSPRQGPAIGDPPISAIEGTEWNGILATISDSDGDGSYGQPETVSGTIDWGDGNSSPFNLSVPEDGTTAYLSNGHTWMETGTYTVTVSASDPDGGQSQASDTATVADGALSWQENPPNEWNQQFNGGPTLFAPNAQTNSEGDSVYLPVQATDGDGDSLSYDALDLPPGLSINGSTGLISGTVAYTDADQFDGTYGSTIIVSDGNDGSAQASFSWTIKPAQIAPVLTNPGNQTNLRGDNVSLQLNATQIDNNPLTYSASNLPTGLSIDAETDLISGTVDPSATLGVPYAVTVTASDDVTDLSASQSFNWTINASNVAPVLTNPGNQINSAGDQVALQLSASDADDDGLTYTATGLPPGLAIDPIVGTISGTLPNSAASSTPYNVTVTSSDGIASNSQSFTWTVNAASLQNPGAQSNLDGDSVSLQFTGSDAYGKTLSYSATGLPPGLSINSSTGLISGTISTTADTGSPYAVTITAKDSANNSLSQSFTWTVARLTLNPVNDQENQEGTSVSLQLSATDHIGTPSYSATGLPPGLSISSTGLITGKVGIGSYGSSPYQVTVTATDGSYTSSQSFVWTVTPRVALVNPGDQYNATGDSVSVQVSATSPGGTMSYSATGLPSGLSINSSTGLITGTIASGDDTNSPYTVTVTANDGTSSSSQTFAWNVSVINLVPPGDQTNNDGDTVSLSLTTCYHGSGTLSYSATGLPTGLSINSTTGAITGKITGTADTNSPYSITVTATDGTNTSSQSFAWAVNPVVTIDGLDDQSNAVDDAVSLQVTASDSLNNTLTYSAKNLPSGLSINSTGLISGTIAAGADTSSPYAVTVTVTDSAGNSATLSFNWTVAHVSLVSPGPQWNIDGQAVSLQLQGHDADGDTASYTASGLPSGLNINTSTGLITGTIASNADTNSPYNVIVSASDGMHTTTQTFLWTVSQVSLTLPSDQTNTEGDTLSLQLQGMASSGSLTYNASGLPSGLSINTATGRIIGTIPPGAAANGPYTVNVSVSNGMDSTSQSFTWTVNPVVNLTTPADQNNNVGDSVSLQISATDVLNKALNYSASGLPAGLSINSSTGLISGKISSGDPNGGPYVVTVTASDGTYSSGATFNWNVNDTAGLTMTNPGTQVYVAGDWVSVQVTASDPDGDAVTYSSCSLPDGLEIDPVSGIISGILAEDAADPVPYQTTVTATDGNGQSVSQTFTWIVNAPPIIAQGVPLNLVEGVDPGSFTIATFTTPDMNSLPDDFGAIINYGDGATDYGAISGGNGSFTVTSDHVYAEKGSYPVGIQIIDGLTGGSTTTATTATVAEAALTLTGGFELGDAWDNQPTSFTVAAFTDANAGAPLTDFSATINWGDGSPIISGPGYVQETPQGTFLVVAAHTYPDPWSTPPDPATYTVSVTVTDVDGASASTTSTIVVGDIEAQKPAGMDWTFYDANPYATTNDFEVNGQKGMALVNWGDGSSSTVALTGGPGNGIGSVAFAIQGSHIYADSLDQPSQNYKVTVTATDVDGNTLTGIEYVSVVRPNESLDVGDVDIASNLTVSNAPVAVFSVPDAVDGDSEFNATIAWGDGNSSSGTIQEIAPGLFQVLGSHVYASYDWYTIAVTISQNWQQAAANAKGAGGAGGTPEVKIVNELIDPVDKLHIGKWETAFELDESKSFPGLGTKSIVLRKEFPGLDQDCFQVQITDRSPQILGSPLDTITAHGSTTSDPKGHDLTLSPSVRLGHFLSPWQLLVSVSADTVLPSSFLAYLGDTVKFTYKGSEATATVPVQNVVKLHINFLRNKKKADGGTPIISKSTVEEYVKWANLVYAQVGIRFKVESPINIVDPPPGVDLSNDFLGYSGVDEGGHIRMTDEEKALLGYQPYRTPADNDIEVYYVNQIIDMDNRSYPGESFWAKGVPEVKYADSIICAAEGVKSSEEGGLTLAHEIGHILLNSGEHEDSYVGLNLINLMVSPYRKVTGEITDSRRITAHQSKEMFDNRKNLLLNP